jgi:hypothetical protein
MADAMIEARCPVFLGTAEATLRSMCPKQYPPPLQAGRQHWA